MKDLKILVRTVISFKYTTQMNKHLLKDYYGQELRCYGSKDGVMGNHRFILWPKSNLVTAHRTGENYYPNGAAICF